MAKQEVKKNSLQSENNNKSVELIGLEQELTTVNPQIFQGVPAKKKEEIFRSISVTRIQEKSHSGPLPDAETLINVLFCHT